MITSPAILRRTSRTSIGRALGFLFSSVNRVAVNTSKLLSVTEFEGCMFMILVLENLLWIFEEPLAELI